MRRALTIAWAVLASCAAFLCQVFSTLHPQAIFQHPSDFVGMWTASAMMYYSAWQYEKTRRRQDDTEALRP